MMDFHEVGPADPHEAARCPEIEARAAIRFDPEDLPPGVAGQVNEVETLVAAQREGRLLVARVDDGQTLVGFALLEEHGDEAHLEELDVLPEYGGVGIGRDLLEAACAWARIKGFASITLSTFRDVPWNGPFYARAGFEEIPREAWSASLVAAAAAEVEAGLDPARRIMMRRRLDGAPQDTAE